MTQQSHKEDQDILLDLVELIQHFEYERREEIYDKIFDMLNQLMPHKYATIFLLNPDEKKIQLVAQRGKAIDLIRLVEFEFGRGFSAWIAKERKTVYLNNLHKEMLYHSKTLRSFLSMPLLLENDLVGVINFGDEEADAFDPAVFPRLKVLTSLLAGLLSRNRLIEQLKEQNRRILEMNRKLEEAREKLLMAERKAAISATVVSLNHEINNPLMVITGNLDLLKRQISDDGQQQRIGIINQQLARITDLMKKLHEIEEPLLEDYLEGESDKMITIGHDMRENNHEDE